MSLKDIASKGFGYPMDSQPHKFQSIYYIIGVYGARDVKDNVHRFYNVSNKYRIYVDHDGTPEDEINKLEQQIQKIEDQNYVELKKVRPDVNKTDCVWLSISITPIRNQFHIF